MLENLPFGSDIIEVAIALAFTYMIFSSISSGIYEVIAKLTKMRSKHLKDGLRAMLEDPDRTKIVDELYKHRLVKSKLRDKLGDPTYIEATHFATALFDFLTKDNTGEILKTKDEVLKKINDYVGDGPLRTSLVRIVNDGSDKVVDIEARLMGSIEKVETWFDGHMRDVTEWYKNKSRVMLGIIAFAITVAFNVDSVRIAKIMWTDDEVRTATVQAAEGYYDSRVAQLSKHINGHQPSEAPDAGIISPDSIASDSGVAPAPAPAPSTDTLSSEEYFRQLNAALDTVENMINQTTVLPVGWSDDLRSAPCCGENCKSQDGKSSANNPHKTEMSCGVWVVWKVLGLIITWGAIFLGGPYWFDIVKRLITWRRTLASVATGGGQKSGK